jgi:hypothetical protein
MVGRLDGMRRSAARKRAQELLIWLSVAWCAVLIAVFAPLAVRRYRRAAAR